MRDLAHVRRAACAEAQRIHIGTQATCGCGRIYFRTSERVECPACMEARTRRVWGQMLGETPADPIGTRMLVYAVVMAACVAGLCLYLYA